jgi:hypothetical protein
LQLVEALTRFKIGQTDLSSTTQRSVADQVLDAIALESVTSQEVPEPITASLVLSFRHGIRLLMCYTISA